MKAIDYAKQACDTMMRKFAAEDLPPKGGFHYHQGVFLSGMMNTYEVCGEEKYFVYIKQWVDSIIYADGSIHSFDKSMLDDIQPGILLYPLYRKTGDERYKIALNTLIDVLRTWKKNPSGDFGTRSVIRTRCGWIRFICADRFRQNLRNLAEKVILWIRRQSRQSSCLSICMMKRQA